MAMTVVIDASALFSAIIPGSAHSEWAWALCKSRELVAPELLGVELAQALRRSVRAGKLSDSQAWQARDKTTSLVGEFFPHAPLPAAVWNMRDNRSACDATYVGLASRLEVPLVTLDRVLAQTVSGRCAVMLPD